MAKKKKQKKKSDKRPVKAATPTPPKNPPKPKPPRMAEADDVAAQRAVARRQRFVRRGLIALAAAAVIALVVWLVINVRELADLPNPDAKPPKSYSVPANATREGLPVGDTAAPVVVELYLDYNCPHCRDFEDRIGDWIDANTEAGNIKVLYHPIARISPYSVLASAAAGCAYDGGKFVEFNAAVFPEQRDKLDEDKLVEIGKDVGLTSKTFKDCVEDRKYENWTLGLNQEAKDAQIIGTPTVILGDTELVPGEGTEMKDFVKKLRERISEAITGAGRQPVKS